MESLPIIAVITFWGVIIAHVLNNIFDVLKRIAKALEGKRDTSEV